MRAAQGTTQHSSPGHTYLPAKRDCSRSGPAAAYAKEFPASALRCFLEKSPEPRFSQTHQPLIVHTAGAPSQPPLSWKNMLSAVTLTMQVQRKVEIFIGLS